MKVAVFSDIHGNLEALQAVAADLEHLEGVKVICLGDLIGYGPDPEEVVNFVRRSGFEAILGNHEFALGDLRGRRWLNFQAAENNELVGKLLSQENLKYCLELPQFIQYRGGYFVHGYPPDSVLKYLHMQSDERVVKLFSKKNANIYFLGHTHRLQLVIVDDQKVERKVLPTGRTKLDVRKNYIVNCGSVGQPRCRDNRARYLLWDPEDNSVEVRCVDYDNKKTIQKIRERGLPEAYALRLQ